MPTSCSPPPRASTRRSRSTRGPERLDPPKRLLRLAVEAGCRVSIDSDAHAPGQLFWLGNGCERAFLCGVTPPMIVNTLGADDLLAWTASHGSG